MRKDYFAGAKTWRENNPDLTIDDIEDVISRLLMQKKSIAFKADAQESIDSINKSVEYLSTEVRELVKKAEVPIENNASEKLVQSLKKEENPSNECQQEVVLDTSSLVNYDEKVNKISDAEKKESLTALKSNGVFKRASQLLERRSRPRV